MDRSPANCPQSPAPSLLSSRSIKLRKSISSLSQSFLASQHQRSPSQVKEKPPTLRHVSSKSSLISTVERPSKSNKRKEGNSHEKRPKLTISDDDLPAQTSFTSYRIRTHQKYMGSQGAAQPGDPQLQQPQRPQPTLDEPFSSSFKDPRRAPPPRRDTPRPQLSLTDPVPSLPMPTPGLRKTKTKRILDTKKPLPPVPGTGEWRPPAPPMFSERGDAKVVKPTALPKATEAPRDLTLDVQIVQQLNVSPLVPSAPAAPPIELENRSPPSPILGAAAPGCMTMLLESINTAVDEFRSFKTPTPPPESDASIGECCSSLQKDTLRAELDKVFGLGDFESLDRPRSLQKPPPTPPDTPESPIGPPTKPIVLPLAPLQLPAEQLVPSAESVSPVDSAASPLDPFTLPPGSLDLIIPRDELNSSTSWLNLCSPAGSCASSVRSGSIYTIQEDSEPLTPRASPPSLNYAPIEPHSPGPAPTRRPPSPPQRSDSTTPTPPKTTAFVPPGNLLSLPSEVLAQIFAHLPPTSVRSFALTNRDVHTVFTEFSPRILPTVAPPLPPPSPLPPTVYHPSPQVIKTIKHLIRTRCHFFLPLHLFRPRSLADEAAFDLALHNIWSFSCRFSASPSADIAPQIHWLEQQNLDQSQLRNMFELYQCLGVLLCPLTADPNAGVQAGVIGSEERDIARRAEEVAMYCQTMPLDRLLPVVKAETELEQWEGVSSLGVPIDVGGEARRIFLKRAVQTAVEKMSDKTTNEEAKEEEVIQNEWELGGTVKTVKLEEFPVPPLRMRTPAPAAPEQGVRLRYF